MHNVQFLDDGAVLRVVVRRFSRETGNQVRTHGKIWAPRFQPANKLHGVTAQVAAFHALQDQVRPVLQREMQVRHQSRLALEQFTQQGIDLHPVERGHAQPGKLREPRENGGHEVSQRRRAGKIVAPARHVHTGQHHFTGALVQMPFHLLQNLCDGKGATGAASLRDDAEGAGVIASVLHPDEGAGVF